MDYSINLPAKNSKETIKNEDKKNLSVVENKIIRLLRNFLIKIFEKHFSNNSSKKNFKKFLIDLNVFMTILFKILCFFKKENKSLSKRYLQEEITSTILLIFLLLIQIIIDIESIKKKVEKYLNILMMTIAVFFCVLISFNFYSQINIITKTKEKIPEEFFWIGMHLAVSLYFYLDYLNKIKMNLIVILVVFCFLQIKIPIFDKIYLQGIFILVLLLIFLVFFTFNYLINDFFYQANDNYEKSSKKEIKFLNSEKNSSINKINNPSLSSNNNINNNNNCTFNNLSISTNNNAIVIDKKKLKKSILKATSLPICLIDENNNFFFYNKYFLELFEKDNVDPDLVLQEIFSLEFYKFSYFNDDQEIIDALKIEALKKKNISKGNSIYTLQTSLYEDIDNIAMKDKEIAIGNKGKSVSETLNDLKNVKGILDHLKNKYKEKAMNINLLSEFKIFKLDNNEDSFKMYFCENNQNKIKDNENAVRSTLKKNTNSSNASKKRNNFRKKSQLVYFFLIFIRKMSIQIKFLK